MNPLPGQPPVLSRDAASLSPWPSLLPVPSTTSTLSLMSSAKPPTVMLLALVTHLFVRGLVALKAPFSNFQRVPHFSGAFFSPLTLPAPPVSEGGPQGTIGLGALLSLVFSLLLLSLSPVPVAASATAASDSATGCLPLKASPLLS